MERHKNIGTMKPVQVTKDILKLSKEDLTKEAVRNATEVMAADNIQPVVLMAQAKKAALYLKHFIDELEPQTREDVYQELAGTTQIESDIYGVVFSVSQTGDRYDYDKDPKYLKMKQDLAERARFLKSIAISKNTIADADGEVYPIIGIKTPSAEVLKTRIK